MSGGSYEYAYRHVFEFRDLLLHRAKTPERRAFLAHLELVAEAMKAIEWEDSGDGADDCAAILRCISVGALLESELSRAEEAAKVLDIVIARARPMLKVTP